jgi:aspartate/methionine/tyrosine aminotransferase
MKIPPFQLERYFAKYEFSAPYMLCCSDCESFSVDELLALDEDASAEFGRVWLGYTPSPGHPELRERIAALYEQTGGEHVLVHSGAEEAIFNFMNAVLEKADHVVVHYPCYQSLIEIARSIGCEITKWEAKEENNWELDLTCLESSIKQNTKLVVVNCPHNPTGFLMGQGELNHLVELSQKHGFLIFSDEVYRLLEYNNKDTLSALCDLDERGVSLGVMSKSFGLAGLRIGWIATRNKALYQHLAAFKDYTTICNSAPSEYLAALALKHKERVIGRNLAIIKDNLAVLGAFFERHQDTFSWSMPKAGPIAFPGYLGKNGVGKFCGQLISEAGVLLLPGTLYDPAYHNFRIGFGRRNLPQCVEQLEGFLQKKSR